MTIHLKPAKMPDGGERRVVLEDGTVMKPDGVRVESLTPEWHRRIRHGDVVRVTPRPKTKKD